jgi:hypothetical protein
MTTGYSGKPLAVKLGLKPGMRVALRHTPGDYERLLGPLPPGVELAHGLEAPCDLIHAFYIQRSGLQHDFPRLKQALATAGSLWISWPKKSSNVESDLDENVIREIGLANGLVDVKVAAVDATWSALKFVRRLKDRTPAL